MSDYEQEILYWLAINREAVSLAQLRDDILSPVAKQQSGASFAGQLTSR
ncbi:MAG: hypothetical protein F6K10_06495 [Moorea sp. SIO2B7]|nr:hypothetical protein [Moorena sp. SIO2B7]